MYCWICGRECTNYHFVFYRDRKYPVCSDDRTCGELGPYHRLHTDQDEQLLISLVKNNLPIPARLKSSYLLFKVRNRLQHPNKNTSSI